MNAVWSVVVGGMGRVHNSRDEGHARIDYDLYVNASRQHFGRAAGEPVVLFKDGVIVREHDPADETEDLP